MAGVFAPLRKEQVRGGGGGGVHDDDATTCSAVTLSRVLQRLRERAAATKLRSNNKLAVGERDVRCRGADCSLQLLCFASVEARGAGLDQNAALRRHRLYQLQAQLLAAAGCEDDG
jgi:hypothetical protein